MGNPKIGKRKPSLFSKSILYASARGNWGSLREPQNCLGLSLARTVFDSPTSLDASLYEGGSWPFLRIAPLTPCPGPRSGAPFLISVRGRGFSMPFGNKTETDSDLLPNQERQARLPSNRLLDPPADSTDIGIKDISFVPEGPSKPTFTWLLHALGFSDSQSSMADFHGSWFLARFFEGEKAARRRFHLIHLGSEGSWPSQIPGQ